MTVAVAEVKTFALKEVEEVEDQSKLIDEDMVKIVNVKVTRIPLILRQENLSCVSTVKLTTTCPDTALSQDVQAKDKEAPSPHTLQKMTMDKNIQWS